MKRSTLQLIGTAAVLAAIGSFVGCGTTSGSASPPKSTAAPAQPTQPAPEPSPAAGVDLAASSNTSAGTAAPAQPVQPAPEPASADAAALIPAVSARDLVSSYRGNEIQFNRTYLDKKIQVTGEVTRVGVSNGEPTINLKDGSLFDMFAYCLASEMDAAAGLRTGNNVTLVGVCTVLLGKVVLRDCVIKDK
jgi:hypothetical protein